MIWALAALLFFSGANVLALVLPFSTLTILLCIMLFLSIKVSLNTAQVALLLCAVLAGVAGMAVANDFGDLARNLRQLAVIAVAALLAAIYRNDVDEVVGKYFVLFGGASFIGQMFYFLAPDAQFFTVSLPPRLYLVGFSSIIFDSGYMPATIFGPYRFQGLFDEPGTFGVFSAAGAFWAAGRRRWAIFGVMMSGLVLSQSAGGVVVLAGLVLFRGLSRLPLVVRVLGIVVTGLAIAVVAASVTAEVASLAERQLLSGQTRANELQYLLARLDGLGWPAGFAETRITAFIPQSLSVGLLRTIVQFGLPLFTIVAALLATAVARASLREPAGILLAALILGGLMRSGVFDSMLGWFTIFSALGRTAPVALHAGDRRAAI